MDAAYRRTLPLLGGFVGLFAVGLGIAVYVETRPVQSWMKQASVAFPHSSVEDPRAVFGVSWVQDMVPVITEPPGASVYAGPHDSPTVLCEATPCSIPSARIARLEEAVLVLPGYVTASIAIHDVLMMPGGGEIRHDFERQPLPEWRHAASSIRQIGTQVTGTMPTEVVTRIVRQSYGRFRLCYDRALEKDAKTAGSIVLRFTITETGEMRGLAVKRASIDMWPFGECVVNGMKNTSFPSAQKPSQVEYGLSFEPPSS